ALRGPAVAGHEHALTDLVAVGAAHIDRARIGVGRPRRRRGERADGKAADDAGRDGATVVAAAPPGLRLAGRGDEARADGRTGERDSEDLQAHAVHRSILRLHPPRPAPGLRMSDVTELCLRARRGAVRRHTMHSAADRPGKPERSKVYLTW